MAVLHHDGIGHAVAIDIDRGDGADLDGVGLAVAVDVDLGHGGDLHDLGHAVAVEVGLDDGHLRHCLASSLARFACVGHRFLACAEVGGSADGARTVDDGSPDGRDHRAWNGRRRTLTPHDRWAPSRPRRVNT